MGKNTSPPGATDGIAAGSPLAAHKPGVAGSSLLGHTPQSIAAVAPNRMKPDSTLQQKPPLFGTWND